MSLMKWLRRKPNRAQALDAGTGARLYDGDTVVRPGGQRWTDLYRSAHAQQTAPPRTTLGQAQGYRVHPNG